MVEQISNYLNKLKNTIENINAKDIEQCAQILIEAYKNNKNIFICGNGGSASTASHFAADINKGVGYGFKKRFKIISLTDNMPTITAYTNDVGYEIIFVEQLKNFYNKGDILIGISGSGNSKNVLNAIEFVNKNGGITIGWTGYDGGNLKKIVSHSVNTNIDDMQISEDMHIVFTHIMMKVLRKELLSGNDCQDDR